MFFESNNQNIRYTGRWGAVKDWGAKGYMTAVAPGAYFEFAFKGTWAEIEFYTEYSYEPHGNVYIEVDGGARIESTIQKYIRINAKGEGTHYVKVIYKSTVEQMNRWYVPLNTKLSVVGIETDELTALAPDERKTIELIGDSITEGVLVANNRVHIQEQMNRPWQDDATSTYGWLLAEAMNLRPYTMGFGATGLTRPGCGCVPKASEQYPYNFDGSPVTFPSCDYIMINHGANDRAPGNVPNARYYDEYYSFLKLVRERNPKSEIIILSAFCGACDATLPEFVERYNKETGDKVHLILSTGWVPLDPLHPLREGHAIIAKHLIEEFKKLGI